MKSLVLHLEGPLQSWGTSSRHSIRETDSEPSKSGVVGLLCAALGVPRNNDGAIAKIASLCMGVRVDRAGRRERDYHTVGAGMFAGEPHTIYGMKYEAAETERYYLSDAAFLVALEGDDSLVEECAAGLRSPVWPLSLGRKTCVPSVPILKSIETSPFDAILRAAPRLERSNEGPLRMVLEAASGEPREDQPVSFAPRRFARRYVETAWTDPPRVSP